MESIFFAKPGEKGLNETSATKLAAIASNLKTKAESQLQNLSFLNVQIDVVGSNGNRIDSEYGVSPSTLGLISGMAHRCGELNGFIAWLREAQKAIEVARKKACTLTIDDWAALKGIVLPDNPKRPSAPNRYTMEDAIQWLSIKERAEYLALEAKAAQLGKLIHPGESFDRARDTMWSRIAKPTNVTGMGRDSVVYYYHPSVKPADVDAEFEKLQKAYQNYESSLNHMKSDMRKMIEQRNTEDAARWQAEQAEYLSERERVADERSRLAVEFNAWYDEQVKAASELKIAIPTMYIDLLKELYEVGK